MTRGFSDPSCVLELFGSAKGFLDYSLSMPDGADPVIHDMEETEWERHAYADKMAKRLGVSLNELKTVAPSQRDGIIFALHDGGYTVREIERYTGISKSTVSRIVRAYAQVRARTEGSE